MSEFNQGNNGNENEPMGIASMVMGILSLVTVGFNSCLSNILSIESFVSSMETLLIPVALTSPMSM